MCMILNRMTLGDLAERLGVKDVRSVSKWCSQHGVSIECENKRKYVWGMDFEVAFQNAFLKRLENKYPKTFMDIYNSAVKDDFLQAYQIMKDDTPVNDSGEYFPLSDSSRDFLNKLK